MKMRSSFILALFIGACLCWDPDFHHYHFKITTTSDKAQALFDQGLMMEFGFDQDDAQKHFQEAIKEDPNCAACYWGLSYSLGPFLNFPMLPEARIAAAYQAGLEAYRLLEQQRDTLSETEVGLIEANHVRFSEDANADQTVGYRAYADAMKALADEHPNNADFLTLYGESLMDLEAHHYFTNESVSGPGPITELTVKAEAALQAAIAVKNNHPFALHLYIHLNEVQLPKAAAIAEAAADELANLNYVGSGHLEHMPGHLFLRVGRYNDCIKANMLAHKADDLYTMHKMMPYGPGHNVAFLVYAACMDGQKNVSVTYSKIMRDVYESDPSRPDSPGVEEGWNYILEVLVRFGDWSGVLADDRDVTEYPFANVLLHYAKGMAYAATGKSEEAAKSYDALTALVDAVDPEFDNSTKVALMLLRARVSLSAGHLDTAVLTVKEAFAFQESWPYGEPPVWNYPIRQCLGELLLQKKEFAAAESMYRADLEQFPANGWSTFGLVQAMKGQPHRWFPEDIARVQKQLDTAWQRADYVLTSSCPSFERTVTDA